ncbi:hypothetical protein NEUTE1DRAFT_118486 [Neurospora tetrasperma FGSC 2508]|uniref:Uncharacterized protein n=1 Tax=Neurospora tetrasperma (strain FGSC 2508 / ATCC MYA-4615 / P0657) TaxID=510951 RepID=F8N2H8_NEUT8|nr:uncharacterized protein NEUTE1DRAFT_118486 [Neurospora tetrasperma FGSC 2508]EGO51650.1 hypothetical protein NEUTE1DRAFT_118486 [Neurospora tetrasperma FGSC 2508]
MITLVETDCKHVLKRQLFACLWYGTLPAQTAFRSTLGTNASTTLQGRVTEMLESFPTW